MPWQECSAVSQRVEFVRLAQAGSTSLAALCRRFGVSRKTGYKWLRRFAATGEADLSDRSRRPVNSPRRTPQALEERVLRVRAEHPVWGGRKIRRVLLNDGLGDVPAASTITAILHRHGLIEPAESSKHKAWLRFEHARPNDLWQMDFKGHFALACGRCHPLTVLDDHSRYCVGLRACDNERGTTVRECLTSLFRRYGLPRRLLMDNGSPWGSDTDHPWTPLTVWLLRLDIGVSHGRPYHPQTQGKDERFHRTLNAELLRGSRFENLAACQCSFDGWRQIYNERRPHEALDMEPPIKRYSVSPRRFPEQLPVIEYGPGDAVRRVYDGGQIRYRHREYRVGKAFRGYAVGLRPTARDGVLDVYFGTQRIAWIDERTGGWGRGRPTAESSEKHVDEWLDEPADEWVNELADEAEQVGEVGVAPPAGQASVRSAHSGPAGGQVPNAKRRR